MSATASALSGGSTGHAEIALEPEGPTNEWLGIVLFIVSEAVMFGAFFAQYFYNRILSDGWPTRAGLPPGFERVPWFPLPIILTVVLVSSGFTAHFAQNGIRRDDRDACRRRVFHHLGYLWDGLLLPDRPPWPARLDRRRRAHRGAHQIVHGPLLVAQPLRHRGDGPVLALRRRRVDRAAAGRVHDLSQRALRRFRPIRSCLSH